ncbi:hypothetical protein BraRD5C2_39660 [Bradyrhizobium sp. RD5-C2]|nr:hypothetical protein BraRD5C2_39660 [Bradyrhizobium sp. RD5-C2]
MEKLIIFRCPATGLDVQTLLPLGRRGDKGQRAAYESLNCPVCTRLHFVNLETGKTLGQQS